MSETERRVAAVRDVLARHLPADRAEERARNILMGASGADDPLDVAREALVGHWSLAAYEIPDTLPAEVVRAMEASAP